MMLVVRSFPPNYAELRKAFPFIVGKPHVLFTYGDTIYNPGGRPVPPQIMVHEGVHAARQSDPATWWGRYMAEPGFRLNEELVAHRAEIDCLLRRGARRADLLAVADRLADRMYGGMVSRSAARAMLAV